MKEGRRIWLAFDDTSGNKEMGSYVAGESCLTCCRRCRCCCCVCGRCGLTNRSTAVADAEPPPPMIPVANRGPRFESILATSRDSRFSSFKKADVDMCQSLLFRPTAINQPSLQPSATRLNGFEIFHPFFPREISFFQLFAFIGSFIFRKEFSNGSYRVFGYFYLREKKRSVGLVPFLDFRIVMVIFVEGSARVEKNEARGRLFGICAREYVFARKRSF